MAQGYRRRRVGFTVGIDGAADMDQRVASVKFDLQQSALACRSRSRYYEFSNASHVRRRLSTCGGLHGDVAAGARADEARHRGGDGGRRDQKDDVANSRGLRTPRQAGSGAGGALA